MPVFESGARDPSGRIPPGQRVTEGWPVLHAGHVPRVDLSTWTFQIFGEVKRPVTLSYDEFLQLPATTLKCDIHCVTRWSKLDNEFEGVSFDEVKKLVSVDPGAKYVMVHAENDFTTNVPLADLEGGKALFAYRHNGQDLSPDHGWPLRLVVPHLYFWKSAKWVRGIEFMREDRPGYWERLGYHLYGDPWKEQRYWFS